MAEEFPRRWTEPHFKNPISQKVVTGLKRRELTAAEDEEKKKVRRRDKSCRFPLCGCKKFNLALAVCHQRHRGMGGNPKGDRTTPAGMILLCSARHRENVISLDRGTMRVRALRPRQGWGGPCAFDVNRGNKWIEVARETARHTFEPFTAEQLEILQDLATMLT